MCVIDPHGDVIDDILERIPRERTNNVIVFDPLHDTHTLGLNIFERVEPKMRPLIASTFVATIRSFWEHISWGPRLEQILRNGAYVLLDQPYPVSLLDLPRLLTDDRFRDRALSFVTNHRVRDFFIYEFGKLKDKERAEAISAVNNKLDVFLANPYLSGILGQPRSSFDFQWAMDTGKILLCKFPKGLLGEIESAALSSATNSDSHRQPALDYVQIGEEPG